MGDSSRFIPAGAGNTADTALVSAVSAVHPCGRREHGRGAVISEYTPGSSLRAQGTHLILFLLCLVSRFIPAGAGNT